MNTTLTLFIALLLFITIAYYIFKCSETKYNPFNIYALIPAAGVMVTMGAIFLSFASKNFTFLIVGAIILNIILLIVHSAVHFKDYGSVLFAICDYVIQAIMALLVIMSFGLFIGLIVLGINILDDKLK